MNFIERQLSVIAGEVMKIYKVQITLIAGMAIMSAVVYQLSIAKRGTSAIKGT